MSGHIEAGRTCDSSPVRKKTSNVIILNSKVQDQHENMSRLQNSFSDTVSAFVSLCSNFSYIICVYIKCLSGIQTVAYKTVIHEYTLNHIQV